jgi:putative DNA primase/helicase
LFKWKDLDGKPHEWAMPQAMLASKDPSVWLSRLADEGWIGATGTTARNNLHRYLTSYKTNRRVISVQRTGWHKDVFVFPDINIFPLRCFAVGTAGTAGTVNVSADFTCSHTDKRQWEQREHDKIVLQTETPQNPYITGGTLEDWQNTIGTWSENNSRLVLALCAAFAAPLLNIMEHESFGFNITGKTSSGKSTALQAAASVWGSGADKGGYFLSWNATGNGLEGIAALHNDTLLCLDEIGQAQGNTVKEAAYMLTNGIGKSRARRDGSLRTAKIWRCLVLSTGEKGLAEKLKDEGLQVQAGQLVRLIDIPCDTESDNGLFDVIHGHTSSQSFADAIKQAASTHYGHAARAFIKAFQANRDYAIEKLQTGISTDKINELLPEDDNIDAEVKRVAGHFRLVATAGELAIEWGLVNWGKYTPFWAVQSCFKAWLNHRGGVGSAEDTAILEKVLKFIEEHGTSRFQNIETDERVINRAGFRNKITQDKDEAGVYDAGGTAKTIYYILPEVFKNEVCKGLNPKKAAKVLFNKGILLKDDANHYARRAPRHLPDYGHKRVYTLVFEHEL